MFNPYVKAVLAAAIAFLAGLTAGWDDSVLTTTEIITAAGAGIAALAVVWAAHKTIKWLVSGLLTGMTALGVALQDNKFSLQEGITVGAAVLIALYAVYASANTPADSAPA